MSTSWARDRRVGQRLNKVGFDGVIAIEREAGEQRVKDLVTAVRRLIVY